MGVSPLHSLHRTLSAPSVLPRIDTGQSASRGILMGSPLTAKTLSSRPSHQSHVSRRSIRTATAAVSAAVQDLQHEALAPTMRKAANCPDDMPKASRSQRLENMLRRSRGELEFDNR